MMKFTAKLKHLSHVPTVYWYGCIFLCCVFLYLGHVAAISDSVWGDSHYYYAYTRSVVIDGDWQLHNEAISPQLYFPNTPEIHPKTGQIITLLSPGTGVMWIPGFVIGQGAALVSHALGFPTSIDGYDLINQISVGIWTIGLVVVGLMVLERSLGQFFSLKVARLTVLLLLLTSQLFFYSSIDPMNSHSAEFFLSSVVLWLSVGFVKLAGQKNRNWLLNQTTQVLHTAPLLHQSVRAGLTIGFLGLVRNQDLLIAVPFAWLILRLNLSWIQKIAVLLSAGISAAAIMLGQLLFSWHTFGQLSSPYVIAGFSPNWLNPDFLRIFFSSGNGLLYFAPVTALAVGGLLWQLMKKRNTTVEHEQQAEKSEDSKRTLLAALALLFFALQAYVIACWLPETVGGPYGSRMFTGTLPWLAIGLALIVKTVDERFSAWPKAAQAAAILTPALLFCWNIWQTVQLLLKY